MITVETNFYPVNSTKENTEVTIFGNKIITGTGKYGGITSLVIDAIEKGKFTQEDIDTIASITSLEQLTIDRSDLSGLNLDKFSNLTNVTDLRITNGNLTDRQIKFVDDLSDSRKSSLSILDLRGNNIQTIPTLTGFRYLKIINFAGNHISDISPIRCLEFKPIQKICLSENEISDISPLTCVPVHELNLSMNNISDISCMEDFDESSDLLEKLYLVDNDITDISPLADFVNLEKLVIGSNHISDISVVNSLPNLRKLDISYNKIISISTLTGNTSISNLNISGNNICSLVPIKSLKNLRKLSAISCGISKLDNIFDEYNTNIDTLYIAYNAIEDIGFLTNLLKLHYINLVNNPVTDLSVLLGLSRLKQVFIESDKIKKYPDFETFEGAVYSPCDGTFKRIN